MAGKRKGAVVAAAAVEEEDIYANKFQKLSQAQPSNIGIIICNKMLRQKELLVPASETCKL